LDEGALKHVCGEITNKLSGGLNCPARHCVSVVCLPIQADPLGIFGGMNVYQYAYGNPMVYYDPYGLFGWSSMPPLPQGLVDFSAGFGDSLSFGVTRFIRTTANIGSINYCSSSYRMGEGTAVTMSIVFLGAHLGRNAIYQMGKKEACVLAL